MNLDCPQGWLKISTLEMHTGGEPLRVITGGLPPIEGDTVLERRRYFREHYDHLRTGLMFEPRGHADMYGAILSPSKDPDADYDVFFLHNEGYSTMCGHAIIALTKLVLESSPFLPTQESSVSAAKAGPQTVTFNVPAGRIEAQARLEHGTVRESSFRNVPSFLYKRDEIISVGDLGPVKFDIAYGGAFYAIVEAEPLGLYLDESHYTQLIEAGKTIKHAVMKVMPIEHPFEPDLSFLYGTIFVGSPRAPQHHSRNVCIFAEGEVDRSATGSGVSARAALHHAKGELAPNQPITIESILGSTMTVSAVARTKFGPHDAIIPEVSGTAHYTGRSELWFDPDDALRRGFILR